MELERWLKAAFQDPETGWNMGSFGAIAEFHHVEKDPLPNQTGQLAVITARGGVRISSLDGVRPVAWEMLSPKKHRWSHGLALCLPANKARMQQRKVLTRLGPDRDALRAGDRAAILFDMGLEQHQVDFCIRTTDPELLSVLDAYEGTSLFDPNNPAMAAILKAHPARVALTRIGRVEVYQKIGGPDTGGVSPQGPHTHVLPKLLRAGRTHSSNMPIPEGWVPCAGVHPANPVIDRVGGDKEFDHEQFDAFQHMLEHWGLPDYVETKRRAWTALEEMRPATSFTEPETRLERTALRNALRQWSRQLPQDPVVKQWKAVFDTVSADAEEPLGRGHRHGDN